ncbi:MAG: hypothetical protein IJ324_12755 [Lachnospiraceae bacterium]|nr:hypothetical protein [Lachnospiraceae bacterium]
MASKSFNNNSLCSYFSGLTTGSSPGELVVYLLPMICCLGFQKRTGGTAGAAYFTPAKMG